MKHCHQNKNHDWHELSGKDGGQADRPLERYCSICGAIELYSGLAEKWIYVGNMDEIDVQYGC